MTTRSWRIFDVFRRERGKLVWIDRVYYDTKMTCTEVRNELVNHDDYYTGIVVRRHKDVTPSVTV